MSSGGVLKDFAMFVELFNDAAFHEIVVPLATLLENEMQNLHWRCFDVGGASPETQWMAVSNFLVSHINERVECLQWNPTTRFFTSFFDCCTCALVQISKMNRIIDLIIVRLCFTVLNQYSPAPIVHRQTFSQSFQWNRFRLFHVVEIASLHFLRWDAE